MSLNYASIQAQASAGISFFAGDNPVTYQLITLGAITDDPATGEEVESPETSQDLSGVIRDVSSRDINGESILVGDKKGIFNHQIVIEKGMLIEVDGLRYTVTDPRPVKPGGVVVAYRPILRQVAAYG